MSDKKESFISRYRWPIGIIGIILAFFTADGLLIYKAMSTHDAVAPDSDYYERSLNHATIAADTARAELAGLKAMVVVGASPDATLPRPVDIEIVDKSGAPVGGFAGTVVAIRPSDSRLKNAGQFVEVPGAEGRYRLLLRVPLAGLWEFEVNASKAGQQYRMVVRQDVSI